MRTDRHVKLWATCCQHLGAKSCNLKLLQDHRDLARKLGARVILLGDLVDNGVSAGSKHVGLEWQEAVDPMSQVELAADLLAPVADLIEVVVGGNHAYRTVKACGLHPEKLVAIMLSLKRDGHANSPALPKVIQRVNEVAMLAPQAKYGGVSYVRYTRAHAALMQEIQEIKAGAPQSKGIPFFPGLGMLKIESAGINVALHHGMHNRSRDNWNSLERACRGFRMYFTGHNHRLAWERTTEDIQGQPIEADCYSCGTYQDYEEYASIAMYQRTPAGSLMIDYDKNTDKATFEVLN